MVSGAIVAILKELHHDHVVLVDDTTIPFAPGLVPPRIAPGSRITLRYTRNDGGDGMLIQSIIYG